MLEGRGWGGSTGAQDKVMSREEKKKKHLPKTSSSVSGAMFSTPPPPPSPSDQCEIKTLINSRKGANVAKSSQTPTKADVVPRRGGKGKEKRERGDGGGEDLGGL